MPEGIELTLASTEEGAWQIGANQVSSGYRYIHEGTEYVLDFVDGRWHVAQYQIRSVKGGTDLASRISAVDASFNFPSGVAVSANGEVYLADRFNHVVRKIDLSGIVDTIAGTGSWGYKGDGGMATEAEFGSPAGVAVDAAGNVYVTDQTNHVVRKIDASGIVTTIAGTGNRGHWGDGGPARLAELDSPEGVAVDAAGNVFVADTLNHRVRKIDAAGIITTAAGGVPIPTAGAYLDADYPHEAGDGGSATSAWLHGPTGVAVDAAGNIYVADRLNNRVRKVDAAGVITNFAGSDRRVAGYSGDDSAASEARLNKPTGVAVDAAGNVYVTDQYNDRIRKIDHSTGHISTIAGSSLSGFAGGGGPATDAQLFGPTNVALDSAGNVYVSDSGNERVRKIDASGIISTIGGNGGWRGNQLLEGVRLPQSAAFDSTGRLLFLEDCSVRGMNVVTGDIVTVAGKPYDCGFKGTVGRRPRPISRRAPWRRMGSATCTWPPQLITAYARSTWRGR